MASRGVTGHASLLDDAPMTKRQYLLLATALLLAALDGYDALSMAFVAPALSHDWTLDKGVVGVLLSSGLIGMAVGSLTLSPLADVIGRRPVVLIGLLLLTTGSLLSAFARSVTELVAFRAITGIGIGVMVAMTTLLSAEFSNARTRAMAVAAVATIGFPLGGIVGGLAASALLRSAGWPWVFSLGAIAGAFLLILLLAVLPEAPAFIISRRRPDALARLNRALGSLGHAAVATVPPAAPVAASSYRLLFAPGMAVTTIRLVAINLLVAMAAYYLLNWLPQLVTDAGYPPSRGSMTSAVSGVIGLAGGILMGAMAARVAPARLAMITISGMAVGLVAVGLAPPTLVALIAAAAVFGFSVSGTTGLLYGMLASAFPPSARASGIGLVMGVGRIPSAVAPALAGWMFNAGMSRATVSLSFALGPILAAILVTGLITRAPQRRT